METGNPESGMLVDVLVVKDAPRFDIIHHLQRRHKPRLRALLVDPWGPVRQLTRGGNGLEEGVQQDVQVTVTCYHPLQDLLQHSHPSLCRLGPSFFPGVVNAGDVRTAGTKSYGEMKTVPVLPQILARCVYVGIVELHQSNKPAVYGERERILGLRLLLPWARVHQQPELRLRYETISLAQAVLGSLV